MGKQLKKPASGTPYCVGCGAKGHYLCPTCSNKRREDMHTRLGTPTLPITDDDDDDGDSGLRPMSKNKKRKKRQANRGGQYDRHYTPNFE